MAVANTQQIPFLYRKILKNFRIVKYCAHIWNQHEKWIKTSTNKPMFGPVVLEIACGIFIKKDISSLKHVVKAEGINNSL